MKDKQIGLYAKYLSGHREEFLNDIRDIIPSKRLSLKKLILKKEPIIFLMIEDSPLVYIFVSILRSFFGFNTIGFLFRPLPVFTKKSFKMKAKYFFLRILSFMPSIKTLLIIPDYLHSEFSKISDGWIYDPQLWDISNRQLSLYKNIKAGYEKFSLYEDIKTKANGRKIISALGYQNTMKGFHFFARAFVENADLRDNFLFVFGGKLDGYSELLEKFEKSGGLAINRTVSDEELVILYASSDLIWNLYHKEYDQASGIFGRAVQFGVPSIVRYLSLVDRLCSIEKIPVLSLSSEKINLKSLERASYLDEINGMNFQKKFKKISINNLRNALKLDT